MKTSEEIKKGLECCYGDKEKRHCEKCPNGVMVEGYSEIMCTDFDSLGEGALNYIKQLEKREWDLLDLLSPAWFGKQCYFQQDDGTIYSRASGEYLTLDQAIDEFAGELTNERESELCGKDSNVPRWISTKERLPENGDLVFVIANGKPKSNITLVNACLIASYWKDEGWIADGFEGWEPVDVTHWMPLPEPPKEG